jgi:hypothetical protein
MFLKMRPQICVETSWNYYPVTRRHIPENVVPSHTRCHPSNLQSIIDLSNVEVLFSLWGWNWNFIYEIVSRNSRIEAIAKYTTPNKRVCNLPTSTQLRATWHTDSLDMVVLLSTGASRYHNCWIDGCTSPEYFGYILVSLTLNLFFDLLSPNHIHTRRTAPLTLNIFPTNIRTEYFKNAA